MSSSGGHDFDADAVGYEDALNRGLSPKRAATAVLQRPATKANHVGFAVLRFDQIRMAGAL